MEKFSIGTLVAFLVFLSFLTSMSSSFPGSPRKLQLCIAEHGEGCGEPNPVQDAHSRRFQKGIIFGPPSPARNQNTGESRAPPPGIIYWS
ncbi:hypothetical protein DsansV1_C38g0233491 [Dioscorea sansibarensis]